MFEDGSKFRESLTVLLKTARSPVLFENWVIKFVEFNPGCLVVRNGAKVLFNRARAS